MNATPEHVLKCLKAGQISKEEADYYLREVHHTSVAQLQKEKTSLVPGIMAVLLLGILGIAAFTYQGQITGYLSFSPDETMDISGALGINVSGVLYGEGNGTVYLDTALGSLIVARISSDTAAARTAKASYEPGELVELQNAPAQASYYLDDGAGSMAVDVPFAAPQTSSTLLIIAQDGEDTTTTRLPIIIGNAQRSTPFTNVCDQTCILPGINGTLRIEQDLGSTMNVTVVHVLTAAENREPELAVAIAPLNLETVKTIDLSDHFIDADGDELSYSTGTDSHIAAQIEGSILTVTPLQAGSGTLSIYVSDLKALVPASISFTVPETVQNETPAQNETVQNNTPVQNQTIEQPENNTATNSSNTTVGESPVLNETEPVTNVTTTLDCSSPNPNERPVDCLNVQAATYFEEDIFLENIDRVKVARITPIGNLVLQGRVFAGATGTPQQGAFTIGYKDSNFNYVPTVWIDGEGNLRLKGQLHEENENVLPPSGSYAIINRRGVYMAYAVPETGDLYLRGNVIMFREDAYE